MGLLDKVFKGEPEEILELRKRAEAFEKGFNDRKDYDALQDLALCHLEISRIHPEHSKQTTAFMAGRNYLEKAVSECKVEALKADVLMRAVEIYKETGKDMFLRALYTNVAAAFERLLDGLYSKQMNLKQFNREKAALTPIIAAFHFIAKDVTDGDTEWFDKLFSELDKKIQHQDGAATQTTVRHTYDIKAA